MGHLSKVCRTRQQSATKHQRTEKQHSQSVRVVQMEEEQQENSSDSFGRIYTVKSHSTVPPVRGTMESDSNPSSLKVNTCASYSLISQSAFRELWPSRSLSKTDVRLCTYSAEPISVLGNLTAVVSYKHQYSQEPLIVVEGSGPISWEGIGWITFSLIGGRLIMCSRVHCMQSSSNTKLYSKGGLGTLQGYQARILVTMIP